MSSKKGKPSLITIVRDAMESVGREPTMGHLSFIKSMNPTITPIWLFNERLLKGSKRIIGNLGICQKSMEFALKMFHSSLGIFDGFKNRRESFNSLKCIISHRLLSVANSSPLFANIPHLAGF
jgi:hypothetical protein